jgi:hypothetical protein
VRVYASTATASQMSAQGDEKHCLLHFRDVCRRACAACR